MSHYLKRTSIGIAALFAAVGLSSTAQANSITLSINGGAASGSLATVSGTSNTFTVTVFANLTDEGGGQNIIGADVLYDPSRLTATGCKEAGGTYLLGTSPSPFFGQVVNGTSVYGPGPVGDPQGAFCGAGSPGDGGLLNPGVTNLISQEVNIGVGATAGTLVLGTVTFHIAGLGTTTIDADWGLAGFLGSDFVNRTTGSLGSVSFTNSVIPEPATISLIGLGILGLGLSGRGRSRRN